MRTVRHAFVDADAFTAASPQWRLDAMTSDGSPFRVEHEELIGAGIRVLRQTFGSPVYVTGTAPPHEVRVGLFDGDGVPATWAGDVVRPGILTLGSAGSRCEGFHPRRCTLLALSVPLDDLDVESRAAASRAGMRLRVPLQLCGELERGVRSALERSSESALEGPLLELNALLRAILADGTPLPLRQRALLRAEAVRRAEQMVLERLAAPLTIEDLREAANLSERAVRDAFACLRGASPMRFVRALRLRAAHKELSCCNPDEASVTDVALRCGFSHLGRFSAAYLRAYGEHPSDTLRRPAPSKPAIDA